jgi:hypothetical protein
MYPESAPGDGAAVHAEIDTLTDVWRSIVATRQDTDAAAI